MIQRVIIDDQFFGLPIGDCVRFIFMGTLPSLYMQTPIHFNTFYSATRRAIWLALLMVLWLPWYVVYNSAIRRAICSVLLMALLSLELIDAWYFYVIIVFEHLLWSFMFWHYFDSALFYDCYWVRTVFVSEGVIWFLFASLNIARVVHVRWLSCLNWWHTNVWRNVRNQWCKTVCSVLFSSFDILQ